VNEELVSVCIPTFNRAASLKKCISSVTNQSYKNLEIIILNNDSTDNTAEVTAYFCKQDDRIRALSNPSNIGAANNFNAVIKLANAEYCMWLADDDYLEPDYILACMQQHKADDSYSLVSGSTQFKFSSGRFLSGQTINISMRNPLLRMIIYYLWVGDNGIFYGIYKRRALADIRMESTIGADWLFIAAIAYRGKIRTIDQTVIHRSGDGLSSDLSAIARESNQNKVVQWQPYLGLAHSAYRDLLDNDAVYGNTPTFVRLVLGVIILTMITFKKVILQNIYRLFQKIFGKG
jgi:glycosyltransferase involved in cell wall biosynthesis